MNDKARMPKKRLTLLLVLGLLAAFCLWLAPTGLLEYRLWQARRALKQRDAEQALARLEAAERLDADCGEIHRWKARAYRRLGEYDKVRSSLEQARRLGYPVEELKREEVMTLAQNGQLSKADPQLPKLLIDAGQDGPEICEAFVRGYLDAYRIEQAFRLLDGWQADYPDDPQPYFFRGLFWEHQQSWSKAADSFRRALQLAPQRCDVRLHLAKVLREEHQYREAGEHYQLCLREQPDDPEALAGWGQCLLDQKETALAREVFARLLKGSPDDFDGRLAMGKLELDAGNVQQALDWLEPVAQERPYEFEVRYALAKALAEAGHPERAREHYEFAAASQEAKARVQALMKRITAEPQNVDCRYEIGMTLLEFGEPSVGAVWLRSVLELQPDHRLAHEALSRYYREQGDETLAAKHRRLAEAARKDDGDS